MTDVTCDPEADAVHVRIGQGQIAKTQEAGPFIYDFDAEGRILGSEILSAKHVLAPGDWLAAPVPKAPRSDAAE
ncbi:DUF2283 domain-containing protein [Blastochloris tepida]|uniref:DUF2283 domain-containing protein n=1 Tax=Blastochloris tepida TaxID=2233851 RepID=A0A348G3R2_9HYPH|nr:DUF2283 domain-containing protein [Blastochloris tepida]BBF94195.1 hypothetical protein BLTE_28800 [Blastochloris tepida]